MNYRIVGHDGKTYGPAGLDQIRQWIAQGRLESRTPILPEGAAEWTFIGLLPEFAAQFAGPPPLQAPPRFVLAPAPRTNNFAIWGLVCGCLAWVCCCCGIPLNLLGLTFSIIALVQTSAEPRLQEGRGLAIAGVIISGANLLFCLGWFAFSPSRVSWNFGN
jgi:hypothetical protein